MNKHIVFTGGGSAGHVTPNIALIKQCQQKGWQVSYVGSPTGIEQQLIAPLNIPYYTVSSGKLRRYFSWQNFKDPFKTAWGIVQATRVLRRLKPDLVFSKGGFVAFPVVVAAWINRIPIVVHESDFIPGLANRLGFPFAKKICLTFAAAQNYVKQQQKTVITGTPIRDELFQGDAQSANRLCGFTESKTTLLVSGGGLGAVAINDMVRAVLPQLVEKFNVIHLCGEGKVDSAYEHRSGYKQFTYVDKEMPDLLACADIVIARAGSNTVYELLALQKPHIFIPLPKNVSNGHQILNAQYFVDEGLSYVVQQEELTEAKLLSVLDQVCAQQAEIRARLADYDVQSGTDTIYKVLCAIK